jgi:hypothetical protein
MKYKMKNELERIANLRSEVFEAKAKIAPWKKARSHLKNDSLSDSEGSLPQKYETLRSRRTLPQSDILFVR